ncbi:hypothetical protein BDF14DRAFT_1855089 [Spinellus fusiger]|nr:hypothetical protein BDF14DRAFT_1855089 [Spinellus fusiger]
MYFQHSLNGVSLHFRKNLRMFLNILLKKNEQIKKVKEEMKKERQHRDRSISCSKGYY